MSDYEMEADKAAKDLIATLTDKQQAKLAEVMAQLRKEYHGNNKAWSSVDWSEIVKAIKQLVPDDRTPVPQWLREWPKVKLPEHMAPLPLTELTQRSKGRFNAWEHFVTPQHDLPANVEIALAVIPQLTPQGLQSYLEQLAPELLQAVESKLATFTPPPKPTRAPKPSLKRKAA